MKKIFLKLFYLSGFLLFFALTANAQEQKSTAEKVLDTAGKATIIVVGKTAQAGYEITKFGVKTVGKPLVINVLPKTTKFLLQKSVPVAKKLFVTYLKTRMFL